MTRQEKGTIIGQLTAQFDAHNYCYVVDTTGLTVAEINHFRRDCFNKGVIYCVAKNTLIKKALEKTGKDIDYTDLSEKVLKGFSGLMFSKEVGNLPAKIIKEHKSDFLTLKGACIDGAVFVGEEHLETLAKLKSKAELIGEVMGLLQSPVKNLLAALQSGQNNISGVLTTLSKKAPDA